MLRMKNCKGFTLMEVLVSFAVLTTTGVAMFSFLYPGKVENQAWVNDYGAELSKITLLSAPALKDTTYQHIDGNGIHWEVKCTVSSFDTETCATAVSIRNKADTTRAQHLCRFRSKK